MLIRLNNTSEEKKDFKIVKKSRYWNEEWYAKTYLPNYKGDPLQHFMKYGWKRGYNPSQDFDLRGYRKFYKDVAYSNINPLLHYEKYGKKENRYVKDFAINVIKNSELFDKDWYSATYLIEGDAYDHYLNEGWKKGYNPSLKFSTMGYLIFNKDVAKEDINPLLHYELYGKKENPSRIYKEPISFLLTEDKLQEHKKIQNERIKKEYSEMEENLIVFLLPELSLLGGGVLSINTIAEVSDQLYELHSSKVIMATLPSINTYSEFEKFESKFNVYRFEQIPKYFKKIKKLIIHIPELYVPRFVMKLKPEEMLWIQKVENIQVNVMNQNDIYMPRPQEIKFLRNLVSNITMTVAHKQYCTRQQRTSYNMPVHFLSTSNLVKYYYRPFREKEELLVYSPDEHPYKQRILEKIKKELPKLKLLEINNMSYMQYRKVISRAKWMITFGEGLDGYFAESIRSGCISFAVYNNTFFNPAYDGLENIYNSYPLMFENIVTDIKRLNDQEKYLELNEKLRKIDATEYDDKEYIENIRRFYKKEYTLPLDDVVEIRKQLMERKPLVSIVMATFNGEDFIRQQLISLKHLTYPNLEVIISDDGSSDNTIKIINNFKKRMPLKLVQNKGKHGLNNNFQNALSYATGEFVALSDQDDIWEKNKIEILLSRIDDFDVVHASVKVIDDKGEKHPMGYMHDAYEMDRSKQYKFTDFVHEGPMLGCTSLIRTPLLKRSLPIPEKVIYHDSWIAQYAIKRGKGLCFVDYPVIKYRQHTNNTAKTTFEKDDWNRKQIAYDKCRLVEFEDCLTKQEKIALHEDLNWTILMENFRKYAPQHLELYFNENYHSFSDEFMIGLKKMVNENIIEQENKEA